MGGVELPEVVTDKNGRYEIPGVTGTLLFFTTAPGSDHRFLCDYYPLGVTQPGRPEYFSDLLVFRGDSWSADRCRQVWVPALVHTALFRNASTGHFGLSWARR